MPDAAEDARASLERGPGADGIALADEGLADHTVNFRENLERRLVFGRRSLDDVLGSSREVTEGDPRFGPEQTEELDEGTVADYRRVRESSRCETMRFRCFTRGQREPYSRALSPQLAV